MHLFFFLFLLNIVFDTPPQAHKMITEISKNVLLKMDFFFFWYFLAFNYFWLFEFSLDLIFALMGRIYRQAWHKLKVYILYKVF